MEHRPGVRAQRATASVMDENQEAAHYCPLTALKHSDEPWHTAYALFDSWCHRCSLHLPERGSIVAHGSGGLISSAHAVNSLPFHCQMCQSPDWDKNGNVPL